MAWRAAYSLTALHRQLRIGAPRAAPPATGSDEWGLIGDAAHDPTSDHTPHDFPGWGSQIVTAADFPNRPDLGLDAHKVLDDIRRSHDPRVKYGISNGQMFSSYAVSGYPAWTWRPYNPKNGDRHFTHGHLSVVGDARADSSQPWQTIGAPTEAATLDEEDEMGASFGPTLMAEGQAFLPLCIPPVSAGIADPRKTWLNAGGDFFSSANGVPLRIWLGKGDGSWFALPGYPDGIVTLMSGRVASVELPDGVRLLSVTRWGLDASGKPVGPTTAGANVPANPVSFCFERA